MSYWHTKGKGGLQHPHSHRQMWQSCWLSVQRGRDNWLLSESSLWLLISSWDCACVRAGALQTCECDRNAHHVTPVCNRDLSLWCLPTLPCFIVVSHTRKYISSRGDMWACQIALKCVGLIRSLLDVAAVVLHSKEAENGLILKRKTLLCCKMTQGKCHICPSHSEIFRRSTCLLVNSSLEADWLRMWSVSSFIVPYSRKKHKPFYTLRCGILEALNENLDHFRAQLTKEQSDIWDWRLTRRSRLGARRHGRINEAKVCSLITTGVVCYASDCTLAVHNFKPVLTFQGSFTGESESYADSSSWIRIKVQLGATRTNSIWFIRMCNFSCCAGPVLLASSSQCAALPAQYQHPLQQTAVAARVSLQKWRAEKSFMVSVRKLLHQLGQNWLGL